MTNYLELLTPKNCQLIIIDHQPQMAFGVQSIDRQTLKNNVVIYGTGWRKSRHHWAIRSY